MYFKYISEHYIIINKFSMFISIYYFIICYFFIEYSFPHIQLCNIFLYIVIEFIIMYNNSVMYYFLYSFKIINRIKFNMIIDTYNYNILIALITLYTLFA